MLPETSKNSALGKESILCSICIPVYNEQECIAYFLDTLIESISEIRKKIDIEFEIIAVDDGSTDTTLSILLGYSGRYSYIKVRSFEANSGHHGNYLCISS